MDIAKLPKWAREHIKKIERERDTAIRALNEYCNKQTPSPFRVEDNIGTGEKLGGSKKVRYIQTHSIIVENEGVQLRILVRTYQREHKEIELQWGKPNYATGEVAFIPTTFQAAKLVSKENMR